MSHDNTAELAVIGACLSDADAIAASRQFVTPAHFNEERHRALYEAILSMQDAGKAIDPVTLDDELRREGREQLGGAQLFADCISACAAPTHAAHYARIVARHYYEREIANQAMALAGNPDGKHLEAITTLCLAKAELEAPETFNYSTSLFDAVEDLSKHDKEPVYKFGLGPLDTITDGMKKGEVTTFGASTNQGKSLLLLNLMDSQAKNGTKCLFVGSEMTARETFARHLSIASGLDAWKIRLRKFSEHEYATLREAVADHLYKLPISILDDPEPTLERIEATICRVKPDSVFVDYLERMSLPPAKDLRLSVKEFMRRLKGIARRRNVMINLASQLNRTTYARDNDSPPTLADLSESSAIEKESDRVFLIWRPKILQPDPAAANPKAVLEIIKAKDRHGPNGLKAHLELDGKTLQLRGVEADYAATEEVNA